MKNLKILLIILFSGYTLISCKNEKQTKAEKAVADYEMYVDSLNKVATADLGENWDSIENNYQRRKLAAENALQDLKNRKEFEGKIIVSSDKYELYKASYLAQQQKTIVPNTTSTIRKALFGSNDIGDDMAFSWVNKSNILSVYDNFVTTVEKNKDAYSREDWDEIKLLYEALDTRKNTVENEGLSSADNSKIAKLKIKFAPMYTLNRMGSKAEENSDAKQ
ncbi:DUF6565 domain-containing protein [uncultured Flavobacterium sp.]|jgi:hypothetical protein|uniref:DUF6565 domain-containing protein n=1 Tax=uncultured Flavobacterium sp. TaxID=165435 RepID=UPI00259385C0|nr:DUF6565 domain-containing protein [uncultured Flavobacterium sp.]